MSDWSRLLAMAARHADTWGDRWRQRRAAGRTVPRPAHVQPYLGFGTTARLQLAGRVLHGQPPPPAQPGDSALRNALQFVRRMASSEVPGARLSVRHGELQQQVVADDEGYFQVDLRPVPPLPDEGGLHEVELRLQSDHPAAGGADATQALVMLPSPRARFGVISDIDDTVVRTHVHSRLRMLLTLARTNAHTRQPFEGVAALYRALQAGAGGDEGNPLFYVSSSPWNLYTPLVEYLQAQDIPLGPLLLKDYGDHSLASLHDHHGHKQAAIERVLGTYPALPFVLIGDSSEQDPEIYADIALQRPQRIRAVYIRSPRVNARRQAAVDRLADRVQDAGVPMLGVADSVAAARHALALGLIDEAAVAAVQADRRRDLASPG
ncbi:App1 family protein [Aquabacterium sp. J223]|uniref:App1 family protein n=1 Tax=Aquabacterium sp. J223 TaxID=2898431 RepID=UPI0021ADD13E|nr:phosphatase domain-containing protein [Aquabacterium sp. J223]UUX97217.1 DUF2183 domain-containing protein [Aquabacterium sp. J223]